MLKLLTRTFLKCYYTLENVISTNYNVLKMAKRAKSLHFSCVQVLIVYAITLGRVGE